MSYTPFRTLLRKAVHTTLTLRGLLLFGFLAAVIGESNELDLIVRSYERVADILFTISTDGLAAIQTALGSFWQGFLDAVAGTPLVAALALILSLGLFLGIFWLLAVSQGVLIEAAALAEQKKRVTYRDLILHASSRYWSFLGIYVLRVFALWAPLGIVALIVISLAPNSANEVSILLFFLVLVPLVIILRFLVRLAIAGLMIDNASLGAAIRQSWQLFAKNWLVVIEYALALLGIGFLLFVASSLLAVVFLFPFLLLASIFSALASTTAAVLVKIVGTAVFFITLLVAGVLFTVFDHAAWALLYLSLQNNALKSKLVRLLGR